LYSLCFFPSTTNHAMEFMSRVQRAAHRLPSGLKTMSRTPSTPATSLPLR
jgi:hypothetical protein